MKKTFSCKKCGVVYEATWTKGICTTCRSRRSKAIYNKKNHTASDPNGHRANAVLEHIPGEWITTTWQSFSPGQPHPIQNRWAVEAHNDLVRRYYQGKL